MKKKIYFVFLVSMILVSLGCYIALLSNKACSQPCPVVEEEFDYQKDWYNKSNTIMDYCNFPKDVAWDDNILNLDNYEYLIETIYNIGIDNPLEMDCVELQYLFVERYIGTHRTETEKWYYWYKENKRY
ncbi:MAG TPA: hypothetical protein P5513_01265 [Candidatus Diapherotrites archaeon]|nr:hypothetical protein [Candidatus Diapherotrites archaeon]